MHVKGAIRIQLVAVLLRQNKPVVLSRPPRLHKSCRSAPRRHMWPPRVCIGPRHSLGPVPTKGATVGSWYLDDGHIVGKAPDVIARLLDLQQALGAIGLKLNLAKCNLRGPGIQTVDQELPIFPLGLAPNHRRRSIPVILFGGATGITTLGVPADAPKGVPGRGQPAATECEAKWGAAVEQTNLLLQRLRLYPESQVRLTYCDVVWTLVGWSISCARRS